MNCTALSNSGLFSGLWDGLVSMISLALSLFFEVQVYDVCQRSWWYNLGFLLGVSAGVALGITSLEMFVIALAILIVAYLVFWIFGAMIWGMGFAIGAIIVYFIFFKDKNSNFSFKFKR